MISLPEMTERGTTGVAPFPFPAVIARHASSSSLRGVQPRSNLRPPLRWRFLAYAPNRLQNLRAGKTPSLATSTASPARAIIT